MYRKGNREKEVITCRSCYSWGWALTLRTSWCSLFCSKQVEEEQDKRTNAFYNDKNTYVIGKWINVLAKGIRSKNWTACWTKHFGGPFLLNNSLSIFFPCFSFLLIKYSCNNVFNKIKSIVLHFKSYLFLLKYYNFKWISY